MQLFTLTIWGLEVYNSGNKISYRDYAAAKKNTLPKKFCSGTEYAPEEIPWHIRPDSEITYCWPRCAVFVIWD